MSKIKALGKELTVEDLQKMSVDELNVVCEDLTAQRQEAVRQSLIVQGVKAEKLKVESLIAKLGNLKPAEAKAMLELAKVDPAKLQAAITKANHERLIVKANVAEIGIVAAKS